MAGAKLYLHAGYFAFFICIYGASLVDWSQCATQRLSLARRCLS
jgi:hypothetical protein